MDLLAETQRVADVCRSVFDDSRLASQLTARRKAYEFDGFRLKYEFPHAVHQPRLHQYADEMVAMKQAMNAMATRLAPGPIASPDRLVTVCTLPPAVSQPK